MPRHRQTDINPHYHEVPMLAEYQHSAGHGVVHRRIGFSYAPALVCWCSEASMFGDEARRGVWGSCPSGGLGAVAPM